MEHAVHFAELIIQVARQRVDRFVTTSVRDLHSDSEAFLSLPEALMSLFTTQQARVAGFIGQWLDEAEADPTHHPFVALMCFHTRRFIKENNQFVMLDPTELQALAQLYLSLLRSLHAALSADTQTIAHALRSVLIAHRRRLRRFVAELGLDSDRVGPICREYSPAFQAALLELDPGMTAPPLLDLGCGEQAKLVHHLRRHGLAAFGLDLFAPANVPFLARGDWLAAPLGQRRWGTVVSHMAFSHHFLHHHLGGHPMREQYARRYMSILAALRPGGQFIYTPGLPFIEALLPMEQFQVRRRPLGILPHPPAGKQIARAVGHSTWYVTCVRPVAPPA